MNHPNRVRLSKLSLGLFLALAAAPSFAQTTSAGVGGQVLGADNQPVAGAQVTITHVESGTVSRAVTSADGRYSARGLRVGGPYKIEVTSPSGSDTEDNIFLGLDQVASVDVQLKGGEATTLGTVSVTGTRKAEVFASDNKGLSTNLSRVELDRTPSPDRSIQNIVRSDPRIVITDRDRGAFSAMGQNFRYNYITIDNIPVGDPFGLNDNGLPTKGTPISQDAIESYNISTANYDTSTRRGVGAVVNAITKSGTNEFHGSAYYVYQNPNSMVGKNQSGAKWTGFTKDVTKGATLGGPIIKDKLFFFASYEEGTKSSPGSVYGTADSSATIKVPGVTQANVDAITAIARGYGLTPGDNTSANADIETKRSLVKFDWNISDFHRASLRLSRTEEYEPIIVAGTATGANPRLPLSSNWYALDKKSDAAAFALYDDWSDKFSTEFTVGYSKFTQDRGPLVGGLQPDIIVRTSGADTGPSVEFGTEASSQANALEVKTWTSSFSGNLFLGNHVIKGGIDYQSDDFYNLFLQNYVGAYEFNSIADFQNGTYRRYRLNQPAAGFTLDNVAARFKQKQYGLFLQDTWQATDALSIQYGVRYDLPKVSPDPTFNPCFSAAPGAASLGNKGVCGLRAPVAAAPGRAPTESPTAALGGYGFSNQGTIDGNGVVQPRVSFNYTMDNPLTTQFRGGAGLFVSNTPAVWVANPYSNNGVAQTNYDVNNLRGANDPAFSADPFAQNVPGGTVTPPGLGRSQMNLAVVDPDFKIPTVAKYSFGVDQELGWQGLVLTAEYQHLDVVNGILYQNLNLGAPTGVLPDGRLSYARNPNGVPGSTNQARWNANPSFGQQVILLTNTSKGKSDNFTIQLRRPFADNWSASVAYTHSRATEVNPGTSSVANSSFQNRDYVNPNDDISTTSNYEIPNRIIAQVTYEKAFFGDYKTSISAFYDGHSGAPYSWVFGNDANGDSYIRDLAYIPKGSGDVLFTRGTTAAQADSFLKYIASNSELARYRGQIFDRNGARAPWVNQLDVSVRQEIPGFAAGHKAEVRLDFFNILNMIDKNWGVEKRASFPLERQLVDFAGVDPTTGKYIYDLSRANSGRPVYFDANGNYTPQALPVNESFNPSQRWSVLATVRYSF